jgi:hypothetical protein
VYGGLGVLVYSFQVVGRAVYWLVWCVVAWDVGDFVCEVKVLDGGPGGQSVKAVSSGTEEVSETEADGWDVR